jgi:hypothetical protein
VIFLFHYVQGFLNVCVYVYSNRTMMRWLKNNLCFLRLAGRNISRMSASNTRSSIDQKVENGFAVDGAAKGANEDSVTESELDELEDDTQWLAAATSFSARPGVKRTNTGGGAAADEENQVVNVLVAQGGGGNRISDNQGSDLSISRKSVASLQSVRSILIGDKSSKNLTKKNAGYYPDMDSEKFVRFGT